MQNDNSKFPAVVEGRIGGNLVRTVNARDLHAFLENGDEFAHWIKDRIDQYGFVENTDFVTYRENTQKGRPRIEYAISLEMGKELGMVERTPKGKQVRQYFIECERIALSAPAVSNLVQAREQRLAMNQNLKLAKMAGLDGNQMLIAANRATRKAVGFDFLEAMGISYMEAPQNTVLINATEIGRELGSMSAVRVNHILAENGYQIGRRDIKGRTFWEPTEKGISAGGVMVDTERNNKTGQVRQLRWSSNIVAALRDILKGDVA